ncbi:hypothetical protein TNCV_497121 [Trichonephila clavipes]|nr:hypothetical protein TNCV_497121 [Trichonephila clavipes]
MWTRSLPRQLTVALHIQWRIVIKGGKRATVGRKGLAVGACVGHLQVRKNRKRDRERVKKIEKTIAGFSEKGKRMISEFWTVMLTRSPGRE